MSASRIARAPRQAAILATIVGLHVGAVMLVMAGLHPRLDWLKPVPPTYIYPMPTPPNPPLVGAPPARAGRLPPAARARADGADPAFRRGSPGAGRRPHRGDSRSRLRAWRTYAGTSGADAANEGQPAGRAHRRLLSRRHPAGWPRKGVSSSTSASMPPVVSAPGTSSNARVSPGSMRPWIAWSAGSNSCRLRRDGAAAASSARLPIVFRLD